MLNKQDKKTVQEIAKSFKELRLKKGLRQVDVARKAGINSNYYAKVERGEVVPSAITLKKVLKALGVKSWKF